MRHYLKIIFDVRNVAFLQDAVRYANDLQKNYPDAFVSVRVEM